MSRIIRTSAAAALGAIMAIVSLAGCDVAKSHSPDRAAVAAVAADPALMTEVAGYKLVGKPKVASGTSDGPFEEPGYVSQRWVPERTAVDGSDAGVIAVADMMHAAGWIEGKRSDRRWRTLSKPFVIDTGGEYDGQAVVRVDATSGDVIVSVSVSEAGHGPPWPADSIQARNAETP